MEKHKYPQVSISKGRHSMEIPSGTQALLEELLAASGFGPNDYFTVRIGKGVKSTPHSPRINVKNTVLKTNSVLVELKPGDNGSRHQYYVSMPRGYQGTAENLFNSLKMGENSLLGT